MGVVGRSPRARRCSTSSERRRRCRPLPPHSIVAGGNQDIMSTVVSIYFKFQCRMYSVTLKAIVEEITLSMIEARMYKKLALDESKVKLELSYIPLVFGCEEQIIVYDDEDMLAYLTSFDKENRRSLLHVEAVTRSEHIEQLSRVEKSSVGMNYEELHPNDEEIGPNAITLYRENDRGTQENDQGTQENDHGTQENEVTEAEDDDETTRDDCVDTTVETVVDRLAMGDEYVEHPHYEESSQFMEAWEDGLGLSLRQEFRCRKEIAELVDRASFDKCFRYVLKKVGSSAMGGKMCSTKL